ncbi:STAS domain-containing protein [Mycobacterium yunnanensis]|uniref:STAS domain-containing protein n=1 Tax=Mycobacterium yunnanensis TaxID=368477 RepID=A0A9X2YJM3_9MYCO|nr:STAS domain-containing protein [Mycobacterium yunnanensis]MCV7420583.1 STAS domain-containing protein [Mycobacterium yunnanensis]
MIDDEAVGWQHGWASTHGRLANLARIVVASGDMNGTESSILRRRLADELDGEPTRLVLELSRVTSVGSAFIDVLTDASATAGEADISFCLVAPPNGPVVDALTAAALDELFEISATLSEALIAVNHSETVGAAVVEGAQRARERAQLICEAARKTRDHSRRLRGWGPRAHGSELPSGGD